MIVEYEKMFLKIKKKKLIVSRRHKRQKLLRILFKGHDVVIHLACISNDPSFEFNPKK